MKFFYENSQRIWVVNYFRKKFHDMFDALLNMSMSFFVEYCIVISMKDIIY